MKRRGSTCSGIVMPEDPTVRRSTGFELDGNVRQIEINALLWGDQLVMNDSLRGFSRFDLRNLMAVLLSHDPGVLSVEPEEWLALVELLTVRMTEECLGLQAHEWKICGAAIERVFCSAEASGVITRQEASIRKLNLSVALLKRVPPDPEIEVLNPDAAINLLLRELPISIEDARDMASRWRELDIEQIRRLRLVKNLLSPILGSDQFLKDARVVAWVDVVLLLP